MCSLWCGLWFSEWCVEMCVYGACRDRLINCVCDSQLYVLLTPCFRFVVKKGGKPQSFCLQFLCFGGDLWSAEAIIRLLLSAINLDTVQEYQHLWWCWVLLRVANEVGNVGTDDCCDKKGHPQKRSNNAKQCMFILNSSLNSTAGEIAGERFGSVEIKTGHQPSRTIHWQRDKAPSKGQLQGGKKE